MAVSLVPDTIAIYLIAKENERKGKTLFTKDEVFNYIQRVIQKSAEYGDEQYFAVLSGEYIEDFYETINKICDIDKEKIEINPNKFDAKGKRWASRVIGGIPYPLLMSCIKVLNEKFKEQENNINLNT